MSEDRPHYGATMDQAEMVAILEDLKAKMERGEIRCAALRLFLPDGTWEDVAVGGTEQEQAEALAALRASHQNAN